MVHVGDAVGVGEVVALVTHDAAGPRGAAVHGDGGRVGTWWLKHEHPICERQVGLEPGEVLFEFLS